jgi:hypothetical protein
VSLIWRREILNFSLTRYEITKATFAKPEAIISTLNGFNHFIPRAGKFTFGLITETFQRVLHLN